jgi:hypothetical protein
MAANGKDSQEAFAPVLTAMSTMRDGQREQKQAAHLYLEKFQKSVGGDQKDIPLYGVIKLTTLVGGSLADHDWDLTVSG